MQPIPPPPPSPSKPVFDEAADCDACGAFGAYALDGITLCLACYTGRGSCCAEAEERPPAREEPERAADLTARAGNRSA